MVNSIKFFVIERILGKICIVHLFTKILVICKIHFLNIPLLLCLEYYWLYLLVYWNICYFKPIISHNLVSYHHNIVIILTPSPSLTHVFYKELVRSFYGSVNPSSNLLSFYTSGYVQLNYSIPLLHLYKVNLLAQSCCVLFKDPNKTQTTRKSEILRCPYFIYALANEVYGA